MLCLNVTPPAST
jgi:hypothetical protein